MTGLSLTKGTVVPTQVWYAPAPHKEIFTRDLSRLRRLMQMLLVYYDLNASTEDEVMKSASASLLGVFVMPRFHRLIRDSPCWIN